ncbi:hypothetical protein GCM10017744_002410 [Streptomyces antimycoticus]|uniref:Uncharacterized protein n=1 Tax=Streptomyces antimycoticus TaxID=68175 RepID=A0A499UAP2_9ACTN|nr:hypothetical protein SSPO_004510 [Streptomyces antimycoticus]
MAVGNFPKGARRMACPAGLILADVCDGYPPVLFSSVLTYGSFETVAVVHRVLALGKSDWQP